MSENMKFEFTPEQQDIVCEHFGKHRDDLDEFEIAELLDKVIDDLVR